MFDKESWNEIMVTITRNKVRSLLTAFGVFWGIFMLVVMVGSGNGLKNGTTKGLDVFNANSAFFWCNSTTEAYKGFQKGRYWSMKVKDLDIIRNKVEDLDLVSPVLWGDQSSNNLVRGEKYASYRVMGYAADYSKIERCDLSSGRFFNDMDIKENRKVCVLGEKVISELYAKDENPVGTMLKIAGIYYQVIGVRIAKSDNFQIFCSPDEAVMVPYTTLQKTQNMGEDIHCLAITAKNGVKITEKEDEVKAVLKTIHIISPTDPEAVASFNLEKQISLITLVFIGMNMLIWIVGMGTLLAGIIGVSNIMIVVVRERTKEIGVRRALGATPRVILTQVVSESLVLTMVAGILGLCAGVGLMGLVSLVADAAVAEDASQIFFIDPQISFITAISATIVIILSGLLAGIIPSMRALQIKAIDAIREE